MQLVVKKMILKNMNYIKFTFEDKIIVIINSNLDFPLI